MGNSSVIGEATILTPRKEDAERDWMVIILPAFRGQVTILVKIPFEEIPKAFEGLHSVDDVIEFLGNQRPWAQVNYEFWHSK